MLSCVILFNKKKPVNQFEQINDEFTLLFTFGLQTLYLRISHSQPESKTIIMRCLKGKATSPELGVIHSLSVSPAVYFLTCFPSSLYFFKVISSVGYRRFLLILPYSPPKCYFSLHAQNENICELSHLICCLLYCFDVCVSFCEVQISHFSQPLG